jgi:hypothetical protein
MDMGDGGVTGPLRAEAVAVVRKVALVDGFQNDLEGHLDPTVVECGDTQGPPFSIPLGYVNATNWGRLIGAGAELLLELG